MHIKDNPDFKTVWQLARDWIGEEFDKTDPIEISPALTTMVVATTPEDERNYELEGSR